MRPGIGIAAGIQKQEGQQKEEGMVSSWDAVVAANATEQVLELLVLAMENLGSMDGRFNKVDYALFFLGKVRQGVWLE